jgi:hypothetical protein
VADIVLEWQRLRRIERNLEKAKAMICRPIGPMKQWTVNGEANVPIWNALLAEVWADIKTRHRPDNEVDAVYRKRVEGEDQ